MDHLKGLALLASLGFAMALTVNALLSSFG